MNTIANWRGNYQVLSLDTTSVLIGISLGLFVSILIGTIWKLKYTHKIRSQSIKKSKSVIVGQAVEQIAPLLPGFPYNPKDMMFLGKGVDYIIIKGLHKGRPSQIIFLEIKTGKARLNANEQAIKRLIDSKKVSYQILQI